MVTFPLWFLPELVLVLEMSLFCLLLNCRHHHHICLLILDKTEVNRWNNWTKVKSKSLNINNWMYELIVMMHGWVSVSVYESLNSTRIIKSDSTVLLGFCVSKRSWFRGRKSLPEYWRAGSSWCSTWFPLFIIWLNRELSVLSPTTDQ